MRRLLLLTVGLALVLCAPAAAQRHTYTKTVKMPTIAGYEVRQSQLAAPHPKKDGHIVAMSVNIVNRDGTPVPIRRLMLHHIVFSNLNRRDATCDGRTVLGWDSRPAGFPMPERFYGAGEERAQLYLPGGYGYPMARDDSWFMTYMVMNHRREADQAYIRYTVTWDDDPNYTPVKPYWFDERNCEVDPIYNVSGGGRRGSVDRRTYDYTMPEAGRIVAGGGHVHGGAKRLELSRPDCSSKPVARSLPTWGGPKHPFYTVRPVLHEPGPINMTGFLSGTGIPVARGERVRLTSLYDGRDPHVRVMGIFVVYVAPDAGVTTACRSFPKLWNSPRPPGRYTAPRWPIPLTGLDDDGRAVTIKAPPGRLKRLKSGATVDLSGFRFSRPNVLLRPGAKLTWRFLDSGFSGLHNVTLANGPRAIGTPNLNDGRTASFRFRRRGTYRLFCGLHPVLMSERVVVR